VVLAAPQLLAKQAADLMSITRGNSTHSSSIAPTQEHHSPCTPHQEQHQFLHIITQIPPAKPWSPAEAQEPSQEEKDKKQLGATQEEKGKQPGTDQGEEGQAT
jgi:hypothetical protein